MSSVVVFTPIWVNEVSNIILCSTSSDVNVGRPKVNKLNKKTMVEVDIIMIKDFKVVEELLVSKQFSS